MTESEDCAILGPGPQLQILLNLFTVGIIPQYIRNSHYFLQVRALPVLYASQWWNSHKDSGTAFGYSPVVRYQYSCFS